MLNFNCLTLNPFDCFTNWYRKICLPAPDKVILSTCSKEGIPNARMVLLKKYDESGFVFFTNAYSQKIKEITHNNQVSLVFTDGASSYAKILGHTKQVESLIADQYFATRSRKKQIAAWSSKQSEILDSESEIESKVQFYTEKFRHKNIPRPEFWCGFKVVPQQFEFNDSKNYIIYNFDKEHSNWKILQI